MKNNNKPIATIRGKEIERFYKDSEYELSINKKAKIKENDLLRVGKIEPKEDQSGRPKFWLRLDDNWNLDVDVHLKGQNITNFLKEKNFKGHHSDSNKKGTKCLLDIQLKGGKVNLDGVVIPIPKKRIYKGKIYTCFQDVKQHTVDTFLWK